MYIIFSSKDRTNQNDNTTNFTISFQKPIKFKSAQLISAMIPFTKYNVNSNNNVLVINWNNTNYTITVPVGNYTLGGLATELNTLVQTNINSNITVSVNQSTWLFTFTFSSATPNTGSLILSQSTINYLIGFPGNTNTSSSGSLTSTTAAQFMLDQYFFIQLSPVFQGNNFLSNGQSYSFYVPVNVNNGNLIQYIPNQFEDQKITNESAIMFSTFQITLYDQFKNIVNLNNSEWSFVLKLYND